MRRALLFSLFLLVYWSGQAQQYNPSADSLTWSYNSLYNQANGETLNASGTLVTMPGQWIDWVQPNYTDRFQISSTGTGWSDSSVNGSLVFGITRESSYGTLTFTRNGDSIVAAISLVNPGRKNTELKFTITTVSK